MPVLVIPKADDGGNSNDSNNDNTSVDTNDNQNNDSINADSTNTQSEKAFAPQAKEKVLTVAPQTSQISPTWTNKKADFATPAAKRVLKTNDNDNKHNRINSKETAPLHNADKPTAIIKPMMNKETSRKKTLTYESKQTVNVKTSVSKARQTAKVLPQTGAKKDANSWLGIVLSTLGLSALFVNRKKKKD